MIKPSRTFVGGASPLLPTLTVAVPTPSSLPKSPGHHKQWINACKTGSPTGSNFGYAGPFTEMVHLGNIAYLEKRRIDFDPQREEILPF